MKHSSVFWVSYCHESGRNILEIKMYICLYDDSHHNFAICISNKLLLYQCLNDSITSQAITIGINRLAHLFVCISII